MVLPNRDNGLNDLERALMNLNYTPTTLLRKMIQRDVNITLPRFQVKYNVEMSAVLQKVGTFHGRPWKLINWFVNFCRWE